MDELTNNIAFKVLKYLAPFGDNAGRYIYVDVWRNELINEESQKLEIEVTEDLRLIVETKLKSAWQRILESRG
ncbi:MAG: hypothetical protein HC815_29435 [Richelia sp. RM1_1_1]|nr:hypothetical protein [Richelia sp. RM1_1_1]